MIKQKDEPLRNIFNFSIEVLLYAMMFFIAVIYDRRLGIVFSGTKIAWLRSIAIIFMSIWAAKIVITKQHPFVRTILDWPVASFLLCTTVASLTSIHVYTSIAGFYGRYEGLTTWYIYGLLFFVVTNFLRSSEQLKRLIIVLASSSTLMAIYSIIQRYELDPYMWGGVVTKDRVIGMIGQPNFLAAYILMAFFMILGFFLLGHQKKEHALEDRRKTKAKEAFNLKPYLPVVYFVLIPIIYILMIYNLEAFDVLVWYIGFFVMTALAVLFAFTYQEMPSWLLDLVLCISLFLDYVCILYTQSRGGYMGLFTGIVLFACVAGREVMFANWKKLTLLAVLIVAITVATMAQPDNSPFSRFSAEITTKTTAEKAESKLELKGAAGSRGETWKSAFGVVADNPVFGVGPEVLKMVFPRYETDLFRFREAFHVKQDRCHNETFDVSVTKGLIAFFVYWWMIFLVFRMGFGKAKEGPSDVKLLMAGLLAAALAYLIQNQFSFGVVAITSLFWVIWGLVVGKEKTGEEEEKVKLSWDDVPWLPMAGIVIVAALAIYVSFLSFRGDVWFKAGKTNLEMQKFGPAIDCLDRSLSIYPLEGGTISHLAIAYLNNANATADKQGSMEKATAVLKYGTLVDPFNADNFFMLSRIYFIMGDDKTARRYAETAIKIDPYYAEAYHMMGMLCEKAGNRDQPNNRWEAVAYYKKALVSNPTLEPVMQSLEKVIGPEASLKEYEKIVDTYGGNLALLEHMGKMYISRGEYQKAARMADMMIELDPQKSNGFILREQARGKE